MLIAKLTCLHNQLVNRLEAATSAWLPGLAARFVFASVLLVYFLNSAATKVGNGFPDFLIPTVGAYAQILPPIAEAAGYDPSQIAFFPWGIIVLLGTYAEAILPLLVVLGLFTRLSSLATLGFIAVMTFVDINFHGVDMKTIGSLFDRVQDSPISDQRLLWAFPLVYLVLKGAGSISLDAVLVKFCGKKG